MNLFYRLLIFIMAIVFMFLSVLMTFYALGLAEYNLFVNVLNQTYQSWEFAILFILFFLASAWIVYPFFSNEKKVTPISKSEIGEVDITLDALDSLVNNIALEQEGVTAIKNRLKTKDGSLIINLTAEIFPSKNIPEITDSLQKLVKTYIEDITGVTVGEIKVLVETVASTKKKDE